MERIAPTESGSLIIGVGSIIISLSTRTAGIIYCLPLSLYKKYSTYKTQCNPAVYLADYLACAENLSANALLSEECSGAISSSVNVRSSDRKRQDIVNPLNPAGICLPL